MPGDSSVPDRGIDPDSLADAVSAEPNRDRDSGDAVDSGTSPEADAHGGHTNETRDQRQGAGGSPAVADERMADLERRMAELEADLDAVRGLLDGVDAVDKVVERRASTALAKVEALEARVGTRESGLVRERLADPQNPNPDAGDAGDPASDAEAYTPETHTPSERASATPQADVPRDRDAGRLTGGSPDADGPASAVGSDSSRHERADLDADTANGGAGAISSVGGGGQATNPGSSLTDSTPGRDGATDTDGDPSLASRLRDAFR